MALLDWDMFLERVERNEALALELAHDLLLTLDERIEALAYAISLGEFKAIERNAHSLRGLIAPYGGLELLDLLKLIEEQARALVLECSALPLEISGMGIALKRELTEKVDSIEKSLAQKSEAANLQFTGDERSFI
ncbi:MAG: hypothetical protein H7249_07975 [Chitinophagaceae bacterium]|nr:hypothetical protein [Oligoflexus sp.]